MFVDVKSAMEYFCDIFKLEIYSIDYNGTGEWYDYEYYIVLYPTREEDAPLNDENSYIYYASATYDGIYIRDEYMEERNEDYMRFEDYVEHLINIFKNEGWIYENGQWR